MSAPTCGCRSYGNQYGHYFKPCEEHFSEIKFMAALTNETPEEFLNRVILEHVEYVLEGTRYDHRHRVGS
jgi:hypothetical protein